MRYFEITSGVRLHLSMEEQGIMDKMAEPIAKSSLSEREQEVARRMVSRGLIVRYRADGAIMFRINKTKLERD